MRYYEFYDEPHPEHPAKREHPRRIARLHAYKAECADMEALCAKYGATVIGVEQVPIIAAFVAAALCASGEEALALQLEWCEWCETSPHRPRTPAEIDAFNARHAGIDDIPPEWRF